MFLKCIINQTLIYSYEKDKNLFVVQRYLRRFYGIRASIKTLKKRSRYLKLSGKIKEMIATTFNNLN